MVENKWVMWPLMWLKWSVTTINTTLQLLEIYIDIDEQHYLRVSYYIFLNHENKSHMWIQ